MSSLKGRAVLQGILNSRQGREALGRFGNQLWNKGSGLGPSTPSPTYMMQSLKTGNSMSFSARLKNLNTQCAPPVANLANPAQIARSAELSPAGASDFFSGLVSRSFALTTRTVVPQDAGLSYSSLAKAIGLPLAVSSPLKALQSSGCHMQNGQIGQMIQSASRQCRQAALHSRAHIRGQAAGKGEQGATATAEMPAMGGYIGWYLRMLQEKPIITKCLTASAILTAADATTQILTIEGELPPLSETANVFDFPRLGRMAAIGLIMWGPTLHLWYGLMARILPGTDLLSAVKKMALGQVSYGPAFTAIFFSINGAAQGESPHEIWMRLKRDLIPTLLKGLLFWPICDIINFRYMPLHLQPLGNNCAAFVWNIYVTYVASQTKVD